MVESTVPGFSSSRWQPDPSHRRSAAGSRAQPRLAGGAGEVLPVTAWGAGSCWRLSTRPDRQREHGAGPAPGVHARPRSRHADAVPCGSEGTPTRWCCTVPPARPFPPVPSILDGVCFGPSRPTSRAFPRWVWRRD